MRDQRQVGWRHRIVAQLVRTDPGEPLIFLRRDYSLPAPTDIERHQQVKISVSMTREGERRQAVFLDDNAELLLQLADQRRLGRLARFDLAAGEFPQASHGTPGRSLGNEDTPIRIDEGARGNQHEFDHHSSGLRGGGMAGCWRPSGMNGSSRYSSSLANHASTSTGLTVDSSGTLRATRRARISLPRMRNPFGKRTASLLPWLKTFGRSDFRNHDR